MSADFLLILPSPLFWVMALFLGLSLGSFTTCVMYRLPRGISLWRQQNGSQRSFCPSCDHALQWRDLLPVLSWVMQKGKCRYCGMKISAYYPMVEITILLCVLVIGYFFRYSYLFFIISFLVPFIAGAGAVIWKWITERLAR